MTCLLVFLPTLVAVMLLADRCLGSDNNNNNNGTTTTTVVSASELSSSPPSWAAATTDYPTQSPLTNGGNETAGQSAASKPSKFDEHVEDWQYVDEPLKNLTTAAKSVTTVAGNSTVCKMCLIDKAKTRRNKRNHDNRLFKMVVKSSRHRDLYAQLMASVASKQSYRRKRFRRTPGPSTAESSTYKQLFRYKRYRRSVADTAVTAESIASPAEETVDTGAGITDTAAADFSLARLSASKQLYRRKRFRRSAVAAYPNGMIRPYHYSNNNNRYQQQQYGPSLAADLQLQQNRRRRYRYAADPYHYKRNGAAVTAWDRSAEFRRRYLRFPPTHDAPPPAYNNIVNSNSNNPWTPAAVPPGLLSQQQPFSYLPQYPVQQQPPSMGPRSPRLVFRDPIDQGTLQAPFGGGPNGLQDLLVSQPDDVKGQ
ncbi:PREDICTED: uncharacterized protein LOC107172318, partial [Diuraphis noxia]|uniref:uncharacterized protein LOC107172318 n=1 Tax=Diuraphis noxia TaxID=143948 RepID=UPI000763690C